MPLSSIKMAPAWASRYSQRKRKAFSPKPTRRCSPINFSLRRASPRCNHSCCWRARAARRNSHVTTMARTMPSKPVRKPLWTAARKAVDASINRPLSSSRSSSCMDASWDRTESMATLPRFVATIARADSNPWLRRRLMTSTSKVSFVLM